jgi:hypothetical protein
MCTTLFLLYFVSAIDLIEPIPVIDNLYAETMAQINFTFYCLNVTVL